MTLQEGLLAIYAISKRELHRIMNTRIYLICMLVVPAICVVFFLSLMKNGLPTDLPVAVVDMDGTHSSRELIRQLDAFEQTRVVMKTASYTEARCKMQEGRIYAIFYIPKDFERDATNGKRPKLSFYTNSAYLIAGSLIFRDMKTISALAGKSVGLQIGRAKGVSDAQIMAQLQPIAIDTHAIGNPWLNYSVYLNNTLIPALLELLVLMITVFSIGTELKMSTSRELLRMGHNSLTISLIGKLLPQNIIFTIVAAFCTAALYGFGAYPLNCGWMPMLVAMFLLVTACQAVGVMMVGVFPTVRLGLSFACLFGMIGFSLSGFTYPPIAMHPTLQALCQVFPIRHYFLIYVDQALNGRALHYTITQYLWLVGFLILPIFTNGNLKSALLYFKYIP